MNVTINYYRNTRQQHSERCWLQSRDNYCLPHCKGVPEGTEVVCKIATVLPSFRVVQQDVKQTALFALGCQARLDHALKETSWRKNKMELWLFSGINPNSIQVSTRKLNTGFYLENHLSPSPPRPSPPPLLSLCSWSFHYFLGKLTLFSPEETVVGVLQKCIQSALLLNWKVET